MMLVAHNVAAEQVDLTFRFIVGLASTISYITKQ